MVPIFKSGDPSLLTNYRPISILSFFSRVFERIVCDYLFDFICTNNILYDYQFGFRPKHSTQQTIITLIDKFTKSLDNGDYNCQSSTLAVRVLDGSQQKADVVKTDYSDSLLVITKMITGLIQG